MTTILWVLLGYCAAVIFPMPGVSRLILDGWAKLWAAITSKTPTTPTS